MDALFIDLFAAKELKDIVTPGDHVNIQQLSKDYDGVKFIKNITVIPRTGESVTWYYEPAPSVKLVQFDYDNDLVYIHVG